MGESQNQPFQLSFNRFLRVDFQGSRVTSDSGLLLVRELDERLGLTGLIHPAWRDARPAEAGLAAVGRGASHPARFWSRFAGRMIAALPLPNGFTLNGFTVNG